MSYFLFFPFFSAFLNRIRAVKLIAGAIANAIIEGRQGEDTTEAAEENTEETAEAAE